MADDNRNVIVYYPVSAGGHLAGEKYAVKDAATAAQVHPNGVVIGYESEWPQKLNEAAADYLNDKIEAIEALQDGSGKFTAAALAPNAVGRAALDASVAASVVVNVTSSTFGAVGDGVADDSAAILAAMNAANATLVTAAQAGAKAKVYLPQGTYLLASALPIKDRIDIVGDGPGLTILKPVGAVGAFNEVRDIASPVTNVTFRDLEIDGSLQTLDNGVYRTRIKGIFADKMRRCSFINVYIHDTAATGLGVDHLQSTIIHACRVEGCGRLNSGSDAGGSGIGIAVGELDQTREDVSITQCHVINNKRYGIFLESGDKNKSSRGAVIVGNSVFGNGVGIGECGGSGSTIVGNTLAANGIGIAVDEGTYSPGKPGKKVLIGLNTILDSTSHGVILNSATTDVGSGLQDLVVRGNQILGSGGVAVFVTMHTDQLKREHIVIDGNELGNSKQAGVYVTAGSTNAIRRLSIVNNRIFNNGQLGGGNTINCGIQLRCKTQDLVIRNNDIWDDQTTKTQDRGIYLESGYTHTDPVIVGNVITAQIKAGRMLISATLAGTPIVRDNQGYNPVGPSVVSATASPMTITAGPAPEVIYLMGGTVSGVTKGGVAVPAAGAVHLGPNEAIVVTYSVAPTITRDQR